MATIANTTGVGLDQVQRLRQQAEELEGVFLGMLTKQMFSSIKTDQESFGGGFGEETWRGMQAEQLATAMAGNGGLGIADQIMGGLLTLQEAANTTKSLNAAQYGAYSK